MLKNIFFFGDGNSDGNIDQRGLLGGKGANLAEMSRIGIPVPPGFTITTRVCGEYYKNDRKIQSSLKKEAGVQLKKIEEITGRSLGNSKNPLLISVRSGSSVSMPGMMDTILNLGINDEVVVTLAQSTNNERFAYDCYRRFIQMYGDVVLNVRHQLFEDIIENLKIEKNIEEDTEFTVADLKKLISFFKECILREKNVVFPQDPMEQLWGAISAVFESWMSDRACFYRKINGISDDLGTAVNVQSMVFGNMGDKSGTGVAFTRDPSTGENLFYGEYLINAQGEDVVAGIRTPKSIRGSEESLEKVMPKVYEDLCKIFHLLEKHYKDVQDIEFTIENEKLWLLQTRSAKRTAAAAIKIAYDMVQEEVLSKEEALLRIDANSINQLLHPQLDNSIKKHLIGKGLPASPGAAHGKVVLDSDLVVERKRQNENVILIRKETSPEDVEGMYNAVGIITARGGMTSHAAVVARGMGKPCVSGVSGLEIDLARREIKIDGFIIKEGEEITIDGSSGEVISGNHPTIDATFSKEFNALLEWADEIREMKVRVNAETPNDVKKAVEFGCEGIGLCRTEHMFFAQNRINIMRQMILAEDKDQREIALNKLLPIQQKDFVELFDIMGEKPVTIRLLDPPLHEFLPHDDRDIEKLSNTLSVSQKKLKKKVNDLTEMNPMLGHRGCRLGVSFPEIYCMQVEAILNAAHEIYQNKKINVNIEIMVPLVGHVSEIDFLKEHIERVKKEKEKEFSYRYNYSLGTMIETPRAAIRAEHLAEKVDFFSFGTNDLTQTTMGISRDDAGIFLEDYINKSIYEVDPFIELDQKGVGQLIEMGCNRGRKKKAGLKLGVCGEHGGDPKSIDFFQRVSLDYVSCSPFRIPIARISSAQAVIKNK